MPVCTIEFKMFRVLRIYNFEFFCQIGSWGIRNLAFQLKFGLTGRDWQKQAFSPEKFLIKFFALETSLTNPPGSETKPNLALRSKGGPRGPLGAQNPKCPFFKENIFFSFAIQLGIKK